MHLGGHARAYSSRHARAEIAEARVLRKMGKLSA
jgi:hypothetical protein